jgi:hypothetical protein
MQKAEKASRIRVEHLQETAQTHHAALVALQKQVQNLMITTILSATTTVNTMTLILLLTTAASMQTNGTASASMSVLPLALAVIHGC